MNHDDLAARLLAWADQLRRGYPLPTRAADAFTEAADALTPPCRATGRHVPVVECFPSDLYPGQWVTWTTMRKDEFSEMFGHGPKENPTVTPNAVFCRWCYCPMPEAPTRTAAEAVAVPLPWKPGDPAPPDATELFKEAGHE